MSREHPIPPDERFARWLLAQISRMQKGSIDLEIEQGQIRCVACHGHRFVYSLDDDPQELPR